MKWFFRGTVPARCYSGETYQGVWTYPTLSPWGAYYHRAAVPKGLLATYGKAEETFSLKTKDHVEALRRVRIAAVEVDQRFDEHRRRLDIQSAPAVHELSTEQLANIKQVYLHHLVVEDEEIRLDGFEEADDPGIGGFSAAPPHLEPRLTFDEYNELVEGMEEVTRFNLARGKQDAFFRDEAEDVLAWDGVGIRLSPQSPDWRKVVRALQEASVEASGIAAKRSEGQVVPTPQEPARRPLRATVLLLLSQAIDEWATERNRTGVWSTACAISSRAPFRNISANGSEIPAYGSSSTTLSLSMVAYLLLVALMSCNNNSTRYAAFFQTLKHQIQL